MATIPRPSVVHLAQEATIPRADRVTIALAAPAETAREGLALSVAVGLTVVGEIFEG